MDRHYEDEVDEEVERGLPHCPPPVQLGVVGGEHLVSIGMVVVSTAMATVELGVVGS